MMIRAFISIELDPDLRGRLAKLQQDIKSELQRTLPRNARLQWVKPESLHVSVKFLGDVEEARLDAIREALSAVTPRYQPLVATIGGVGVFPDPRAPRVLWFGVEPVPALIRCADEVDGALAGLGFTREPRGYTPHLTVARIKDDAREVGGTLENSGLLAAKTIVGTLHVSSLSFMQSVLQPGGSVYRRLFDVAFGNAA